MVLYLENLDCIRDKHFEGELFCAHEYSWSSTKFGLILFLITIGSNCHRKAIKDLTRGLSIDGTNIDCLYLRASCYQAVGQYKEAVLQLSLIFIFGVQCWLTFVMLQLYLMVTGQGLWCCTEFGFGLNGEVCATMPCLLSGLFYCEIIYL